MNAPKYNLLECGGKRSATPLSACRKRPTPHKAVRRFPCHRTPYCAFTLIELLVVIAIIGILAGIAMPAIRGLGSSADAASVSRQITDDLSIARLRAINERTTVYMVFIPPSVAKNTWTGLDKEEQKELNRVINGQYTMYALFAPRTLGDQPGKGTPRYLTEWKTLPHGVFIRTNDFEMLPYNQWNSLSPTNRPLPYFANGANQPLIPFPLARSKKQPLPWIAFNYTGQLIVPGDQVLHMSKGSVTYPKRKDGSYDTKEAQVLEVPKTNWVRNPYIRIDWVTGRARTVQL